MAYNVSSVSSMDDIPSLVASFAATLGWITTSPSSTEITVKHPQYSTARVFTVSSHADGAAHTARSWVTLACDAPGSGTCGAYSPKLNRARVNNSASVELQEPTKLHLFGELVGSASDPGASFIAGVIEYGFNLYRHFYLGYVEKSTNFEGGEVITAGRNEYSGSSGTTGTTYYDQSWNYPFAANLASGGGVYVDHVDNTYPWRKFTLGSTGGASNLDTFLQTNGGEIVLGGFSDSINDGYMVTGKSIFTGNHILTPVNLYIGKRVVSGGINVQRFQPIGYPAGVRLVHMEDLEPGQLITVGQQSWRVFPASGKVLSTSYYMSNNDFSSAYAFPHYNTSYFVGYAYRVS
jgi:hypothetical protein